MPETSLNHLGLQKKHSPNRMSRLALSQQRVKFVQILKKYAQLEFFWKRVLYLGSYTLSFLSDVAPPRALPPLFFILPSFCFKCPPSQLDSPKKKEELSPNWPSLFSSLSPTLEPLVSHSFPFPCSRMCTRPLKVSPNLGRRQIAVAWIW